MAKTTRNTEIPATEPKARQARRKPAAAKAAAAAPAVRAAKTTKARTTTRKTSTIAAEPAVAADRPAAVTAMPPMIVAEPTHGEIAERAYHIYLRRDGWPGNPDHDWRQATEELRAERRRHA